MRRLLRSSQRSREATQHEILIAIQWNNWADRQAELWRMCDRLRRIMGEAEPWVEASDAAKAMSEAMWRLDPAMWDAATATWPESWRERS